MTHGRSRALVVLLLPLAVAALAAGPSRYGRWIAFSMRGLSPAAPGPSIVRITVPPASRISNVTRPGAALAHERVDVAHEVVRRRAVLRRRPQPPRQGLERCGGGFGLVTAVGFPACRLDA